MPEVLIIGAGLAALSTAARLTELGVKDIAVYACGTGGTPLIAGINFVLPENPSSDTPEQYCEDMLRAGYGIGSEELVRDMTSHTRDGHALLCRWGAEFARNADGSLKLRHLSGHSHPRSLCCTTELIGHQLLERMTGRLKKAGVAFFPDCRCVGLLSDGQRVYGAAFLRDGQVFNVYANRTVAAWGGVGNLFGVSTYPGDIRGNTLAIAHDAGAELVDLEFLEYEPMVVMSPPGAVGEPCPTAMLGEGAYLRNAAGERFLLGARPQGEAGAPKTLINREIWKQVSQGQGSPHGGVWVDLRHIPRDVLRGYPWFYNRLMDNGLDPCEELVEVGPMSHSLSGGIRVDRGYRSNLKGLYAVGEACGGVHGACRCAGNAASQATLSGLLCAEAAAEAETFEAKEFPAAYRRDPAVFETFVPRARALAVEALGVYRTGETLRRAAKELDVMLAEPSLSRDGEAGQVLRSIRLMVGSALTREESRGTHLRLDFPQEREKFRREITV